MSPLGVELLLLDASGGAKSGVGAAVDAMLMLPFGELKVLLMLVMVCPIRFRCLGRRNVVISLNDVGSDADTYVAIVD